MHLVVVQVLCGDSLAAMHRVAVQTFDLHAPRSVPQHKRHRLLHRPHGIIRDLRRVEYLALVHPGEAPGPG